MWYETVSHAIAVLSRFNLRSTAFQQELEAAQFEALRRKRHILRVLHGQVHPIFSIGPAVAIRFKTHFGCFARLQQRHFKHTGINDHPVFPNVIARLEE